MAYGFTFRLPLGLLLAFFLGVMLGAVELGRRLGERDRASHDDASRSHATGLSASMLGLVALVLGFAFSLSASHFVLNRDLVAVEANAIDTAYRRADLAGEPERKAIKSALLRYVDLRLAFYAAGIDPVKRRIVDDESLAIQAELWQQAAAAAARAPTCTTALLVHAINGVIEIHETRVDAARNHVPVVVLWLLVAMSCASAGLTGYVSAFGSRRHGTPTAIMLVLVALVLVAIVDLDRPMGGLVSGGQASMLELRRLIPNLP